jgi:hypothetical protein
MMVRGRKKNMSNGSKVLGTPKEPQANAAIGLPVFVRMFGVFRGLKPSRVLRKRMNSRRERREEGILLSFKVFLCALCASARAMFSLYNLNSCYPACSRGNSC